MVAYFKLYFNLNFNIIDRSHFNLCLKKIFIIIFLINFITNYLIRINYCYDFKLIDFTGDFDY
jgi:hypothetical protein